MPPATAHDDDYRPGLDWEVLRQLGAYLKPYRVRFLQLLLIMLVFSGMDATMPLLTKVAIDRFAKTGNTKGIVLFSMVCAAFALGRGLTVRFMIYTGGRIHTGISYDLRRDGFRHLQKLSFAYFDRHAVGWLMSRLTADVLQLSRMFAWGLVDLVDGVGKMILMSAIMLALNVKLAVVVLAVVPILVLIVLRSQVVTLRKFRTVRRANSEMTGSFNEGVQGAPTTKTLVREKESLADFDALTMQLQEVSVEAARRSAVYFPLVLFFGTLGSGLALWVGGDGVIAKDITYGTLVAFATYAVSFFTPLQDLARRFPQLQSAQACAERIFSMLETEADIADTAAAANRVANTNLPDFSGDVEFRSVSFHYTPDEQVLEDFNLHIAPQETVALVGETGAGKTTITSLLCRFYEPVTGQILIDKVDYRELPLSWLRNKIGIVLQTPHLFSGTIRDNIRYGRLDATDADVEQAGHMVGAHGFIMECEGGYEFQVGENGGNLSTGQRQLISLARVVLAQPRLLILDEATSAVDTETEDQIQKAIEQVLVGRTSLVVAHRLSTIRRADRIVLMADGRILEQGSHRELIARRGAYFRLYTSQFVEQAEAKIVG